MSKKGPAGYVTEIVTRTEFQTMRLITPSQIGEIGAAATCGQREATEIWLSTHLNGGKPLEDATTMVDESAQGQRLMTTKQYWLVCAVLTLVGCATPPREPDRPAVGPPAPENVGIEGSRSAREPLYKNTRVWEWSAIGLGVGWIVDGLFLGHSGGCDRGCNPPTYNNGNSNPCSGTNTGFAGFDCGFLTPGNHAQQRRRSFSINFSHSIDRQ